MIAWPGWRMRRTAEAAHVRLPPKKRGWGGALARKRGSEFGAAAGSIWHQRILPRLAIAAGFELGSGMAVNPTRPIDTAAALRHFVQRQCEAPR